MHEYVKEIPLFVDHLTYFSLFPTHQFPNFSSNHVIPFFNTLHRPLFPPNFHFTTNSHENLNHKLTLSVCSRLLRHLPSINLRVSSVILRCRLFTKEFRIFFFSCKGTGFLVPSVKTYMGSKGIVPLILYLDTRWMEGFNLTPILFTMERALLLDQD
jgi:hypothetical protein